jgi:hypothetical protein
MRNIVSPDAIKKSAVFFRIANAHTHHCRIANSAGREFFLRHAAPAGAYAERGEKSLPARRRLQPTSYIKAKLPLCTGLQSRQAVSIIKEHQVTVLIFTGRDFSPGVTERAKLELCLYMRRRIQPAPSGGDGAAAYRKDDNHYFVIGRHEAIQNTVACVETQCIASLHECRLRRDAMHCVSPRARRSLSTVSKIKAKLQLCTGLQSRQAVSIIKKHQVTVLIFTGRDFSPGVTERAKLELCFYIRRRLEPAPSGDKQINKQPNK